MQQFKLIIFKRWLFLTFVLVAWSSMTGCQMMPSTFLYRNRPVIVEEFQTNQPVDHFVAPEFYSLAPRRVVLVVPRIRDNHYEVHTRFANSLERALSEAGTFEILFNGGICDIDMSRINDGTFDERKLWELSQKYNADGVLLCEVNSFSAYEPLELGCSLTFVDTRESIVTVFARGVWDSGNEQVRRKFIQDICKIHRCKSYAAGIYLKSPTEYMNFVARDLAEFFKNVIQKR